MRRGLVVETLLVLPAAFLVLPGGGATAATPTCDGQQATIVDLDAQYDQPVMGTEGPDVIVVDGDYTEVDALGGDDVVCGGGGADTIDAGAGDDRVFGGRDYHGDDAEGDYTSVDRLIGGPGSDYLDGDAPNLDGDGAGIDYSGEPAGITMTTADDGTATVHTSTGVDTLAPSWTGVLGSPYADHLAGGPQSDAISGGGGNDDVTGGEGDDHLHGDAGDDVVRGGPGADSLGDGQIDGPSDAAADTDHLYGGAGDDLFHVDYGPDALEGGAGDDVFDFQRARTGKAVVEGQSGDDRFVDVAFQPGARLSGGSGRNELKTAWVVQGAHPTYIVDLSRDRYAPPGHTSGHTTIEDMALIVLGVADPADVHRDTSVFFTGTRGADRVRAHHDIVLHAHGAGGDDVLVGADRRDYLDGGPGHDRADGRGDRDRCPRDEVRVRCEPR